MIDFTIETEIERPVEEVFAYATDPAKLPTWQLNTVSAVPDGIGPVGRGTRIREVHSAPGGREVPSLVEVSEHEPNRLFALHVLEGPLPLDARLTFEPRGAGTRMAFRVHGSPNGLLKIASPLMKRPLRRQFEAHCAELKRVLES
ncbi:MAG TPA: SRPBCC family protein [Solirubrobacterales bacterium]|nr:SRPBCC family protein [Solirubrobacterales bacterium]